MAGVVAQMLSLDFGGDFQLKPFPFTCASRPDNVLQRGLRHLRHVVEFRRTVVRCRARIVHLHTCSGFTFFRSALDACVARRSGCKVVLHIHGAAFDQFCREAPSWQRRMIARTLRQADGVIALSQGWADELATFAPQARITMIENAVDIPADVPRAGTSPLCRFVLLARMDEWKGVDDFLDACAALRQTSIEFDAVLAGPPGTAGDAAILSDKISQRKLGGFVMYVGAVQGPAKEDLLRWADVLVQPSHHEGMPLAVLEALAHGRPVIATRVGALPEVIEDRQQGLLVPPRRPQLLADAMRELATAYVLRRTMGQCARELAERRFSLIRLRDDLARLYEGAISQSAVAALPRRGAPRATRRLALTPA